MSHERKPWICMLIQRQTKIASLHVPCSPLFILASVQRAIYNLFPIQGRLAKSPMHPWVARIHMRPSDPSYVHVH